MTSDEHNSGTSRLVVLTGGPGGGKTTLAEALAAQGLRTVGEAGRAVIRAELARGGTALPWADRAAFAARMAARDEAAHRAALESLEAGEGEGGSEGGGVVVFDRGLPDTLGYCRLCGLPEPAGLLEALRRCRYRSPVFLAPFWPAIFAGDAERRQDAAEAQETARVMRRTYEGLGYEVVDLPLAPVGERVRFLRERIGV